jgi:hypothetical protein
MKRLGPPPVLNLEQVGACAWYPRSQRHGCCRRHYRSVRLHSSAMSAARPEGALLHAWLDLLQRLTLLAWLPFMIVPSWRITAQAGGVENAIM